MSDLIAEIQAAYERDHRLPSEATRADELPVSFDSINDGWLTAVLCGNVPEAKVIAHELGTAESGSSNRRRIRVTYNAAGVEAGLPMEIFCKASHELANRVVLSISNAAFIEAHFYNRIRRHIDIEAPQCLYARFDPVSFNSMIMLNDLTTSVTEFCNHRTVMTEERARSQMRLLGKLHGTTYWHPEARAQLAQLDIWPVYFGKCEGIGLKEGSNKGFLAAQEVIPARLFKRYEEIWPATLRSLDIHANKPHCLSHGDVHLKNWYVAGNGEMGLGDWQCASRGHWSRDVAYAIATALTVEDRRRWERDLLKYYLEELRAAGGPQVSFEDAWIPYRQQLVTALTWWTVTLTPPSGLPDMQPTDTTLEFIRRIATAMDDNDTMDVLAA